MPVRAVAVALALTVFACHRDASSPEFPGLSIRATCARGNPKYVEEDETFPGERALPGTRRPLAEVGERDLVCEDEQAESYRLSESMVLSPVDVTIRVSRSPDAIRMRAVLWSKEKRRVVNRQERSLTNDEWRSVAQQVLQVDFWNLPRRPLPNPHPPVYMDGGCWHLEGYLKNRYHAIDRCVDDKRIYELSKAFRRLVRVQDLSARR